MSSLAEDVHNQTPYGEKPDPRMIDRYGGREITDDKGRWIARFPDGGEIVEHPLFGCVVRET